MCKALKVSRSGFYKWMKRDSSCRATENKLLVEAIRKYHRQSKGVYGAPRITKELLAAGYQVSRQRVARLMRKHQIRGIQKKKYVCTTDSKHSYPLSPNRLKREFAVGQIGRAWVSDITYIRTRQGWQYLTAVMDLGDRKIIGWSLSKGMKAEETVIPALKMALGYRAVSRPLIFHSDQGIQYACTAFRELLSAYPLIKQSMSRKGNCWDNAVMESFF